ncbi:GFA family protein [Tropicimonas sp. TH_r6]|uniref:GFA family protein n=1 Tax=Tropicimonas sp. TH_r6 TaxID=3082085 RepID=UPI0029530DE5|nr:GFA family protein [Tropicimonas sp. TH_r6]MDV7143626.1 GFA family protein [Tropicimonas sp. TH_r6]
MPNEIRGQCLCGRVRFSVCGPVSRASICHCSQCRRQDGHVWASAQAPRECVHIRGRVTYFAASDVAARGFCPRCGSFLFWDETGAPDLSFSLGALEEPTGIRVEKHIFCADRGDYYDIGEDGVPRQP